jgi:modification methylase
MIWAAKSQQSRYKFNYQAMKTLNDDVQMRSDWTLPLCTGGERLKNTHGLKLHPTQKPEALLHRVIMASTSPGDVIVDPFLGTGTTAAVAKRLHRHFIGIERHPAYVEAAWGRLKAEERAPKSAVIAPPAGREAPRIAFGSFVERGILPPGTQVMDRLRRIAAEVTAEGGLVSGAHRGSIHQVGAAVQNAPSCNGWTYWHFERNGKLVPLDTLRKENAES